MEEARDNNALYAIRGRNWIRSSLSHSQLQSQLSRATTQTLVLVLVDDYLAFSY